MELKNRDAGTSPFTGTNPLSGIRLLLMAAAMAVLTAFAGCGSTPEAPPVVTQQMQDDLVAGFKAITTQQDQCNDMTAYIGTQTIQAQAALKALDDIVDPAFLDPARAGVTKDKGALWACLIARKAGFTTEKTKILRMAIDPRSKLARVIFSIDGYEFGFPMARQDGKWRSPFPGQVFLANQYAFWMDEIKKGIPEENREKLQSRLALAVHKLKGYQPNWALYPEVTDVETDEVQLQVKESAAAAAAAATRAEENTAGGSEGDKATGSEGNTAPTGK